MKKINVGIIGYRGIVGSCFIDRIIKQKDHKKYNFYIICENYIKIKNFKCKKIDFLKKIDILISCKDENYSKYLINKLKSKKWNGYYLDCSSYLRNKETIVLDPLNKKEILNKIKEGKKFFAGGNCTVSLMLISLIGILKKYKIKKIYCSTYQSISGAGYKYFKKFLKLTNKILKKNNLLKKKGLNLNNNRICFSLIPWIDKDLNNGYSNEEKKGQYETRKILSNRKIQIYSTCTRVNTTRCHSLSLLIKIKKKIKLCKFIKNIKNNKYIKYIENKKKQTEKKLNPINVMESDRISVGRVRKFGKYYFSIFVIGDQLIWGAVEPIRRMISIIYKNAYNKN
ncbi:Asd/ArgC dimerization domain-containing protein [Candidatus Vidania fulgoroideorum]